MSEETGATLNHPPAHDHERDVAFVRMTASERENMKAIEQLTVSRRELTATIERLTALDQARVAAIERLTASDQERVATITRLTDSNLALVATVGRQYASDIELTTKIDALVAADQERVTTIYRVSAAYADQVAHVERLAAYDRERVTKIIELSNTIKTFTDNMADEMLIRSRNLSFLDEPNFAAAWNFSRERNAEGWPTGVPDVRWRARIALWAAQQGLARDGDFVECGVHTGLFSLVICHALNFDSLGRQFYLFDTFNGIPLENIAEEEQEKSRHSNEHYYKDVFSIAERNFSPFKNAKLIRGVLPESLVSVPIKKIAYLSVDLNNANSEKRVIEQLWDRIVPGAVIVIDDYLWAGLEAQYDMWNAFALSKNVTIAPLPTGQGLLIKPQNAE